MVNHPAKAPTTSCEISHQQKKSGKHQHSLWFSSSCRRDGALLTALQIAAQLAMRWRVHARAHQLPAARKVTEAFSWLHSCSPSVLCFSFQSLLPRTAHPDQKPVRHRPRRFWSLLPNTSQPQSLIEAGARCP